MLRTQLSHQEVPFHKENPLNTELQRVTKQQSQPHPLGRVTNRHLIPSELKFFQGGVKSVFDVSGKILKIILGPYNQNALKYR